MHFYLKVQKITEKSQNAINNQTILKNSTDKNIFKKVTNFITPFYG